MKRTNYIFALLAGLTTAPLFAQIPNAGFEAWDSLTQVNGITIYNPAEWNSTNIERVSDNAPQTVEMTTDAHTGSYAVKLTSVLNDEQLQVTFLSSGYSWGASPNDPSVDKFPLTGRINGFEGYYKYIPNIEDSFRVFLALYRDGQYLGQSFMEMGTAANTYTKFWWPVIYPATMTPPDSAKFIIEPSIFNDSEGSILFIDDLNITYGFTTGIDAIEQKPNISLYPNPAKDEMTLLGYDPRHRYTYHLSAIDGKQISTGNLTDEHLRVDFLENGLYILTLIDDEGHTSKLKFVKYQ